jgi:hypothetical protein
MTSPDGRRPDHVRRDRRVRVARGAEQLILAASEISEYAFCRQAWYLGRHAAARSVEAEQRRQAGTAAHRHIGRATDHVRQIETARRALVAVMAIVGLLLIMQLAGLSPVAPS